MTAKLRESANPDVVAAESSDGLICVSFRTDGLIHSVDFSPRVKRMSVADVAEGVLNAMAAVQQELRRRAELTAQKSADEDRLDQKLDDIYHEYVRQTAEFQRIGIEILKRMK